MIRYVYGLVIILRVISLPSLLGIWRIFQTCSSRTSHAYTQAQDPLEPSIPKNLSADHTHIIGFLYIQPSLI